MEPFLDPIASPMRVAPPAHILTTVRSRLRRKELRVRRWLQAAAAAAVFVWASTGYLFLSESTPVDEEETGLIAFVDVADNSLYGE